MKIILLMLSLLILNGCSAIGYYSQSIMGQVDILLKRKDVHEVIQSSGTSPELQKSLQQAIEIRQFASQQLFLPDNKSYLYYSDLGRPYVVWNVFAAPEFSLEAKTWCYFIVGCVSYRGYFEQQKADELASELAKENYDVNVSGIAAYSTLGWFNDPLMNTMMQWNTRSLASLIFHELSHQVLYFKSETGFNEAFATAVERLGTIQWILIKTPDKLPGYLAYLEAQQDFRQLIMNTRDRLEEVYHSNANDEEKRANKQIVIDTMKTDYDALKSHWPFGIHFDSWFSQPINNARLTSSMTYLQAVPAFYQAFLENNADWQHFYQSVKALEEVSHEEREQWISEKTQLAPDFAVLVNLIREKHS